MHAGHFLQRYTHSHQPITALALVLRCLGINLGINFKIQYSRYTGDMVTNAYAKYDNHRLHINKALGIFLKTTTATRTRRTTTTTFIPFQIQKPQFCKLHRTQSIRHINYNVQLYGLLSSVPSRVCTVVPRWWTVSSSSDVEARQQLSCPVLPRLHHWSSAALNYPLLGTKPFQYCCCSYLEQFTPARHFRIFVACLPIIPQNSSLHHFLSQSVTMYSACTVTTCHFGHFNHSR